ncbi:unnamed protein product [Staurois parvus]|uniref:Uncharacterized protein n=1 Tax=Staurois parvus TaxID=386267 RepID=A0ABN9DVR5_9NEOB|nr:unnamed protein product [Staurois parvus]
MDTDRLHCWDYTDPALLSSRVVSVTAREERNADNRHFPFYM